MTSLTPGVVAIVCTTWLSACAVQDGPAYNDGIAELAPTGSNIKSRDGYRRGGSSYAVRVIGRQQLRDRPAGNRGQLPNRTEPSPRR